MQRGQDFPFNQLIRMEFQRSVEIIENSRFGQFLQRLADWRPHQLHK